MNCSFINAHIGYYHFTDTGFSCKIVPSLGGSVQELIVGGKTVIKGVPLSSMGKKEYLTFCNSALLFPFPNRVAGGTYTFGDTGFQLEQNEKNLGNAIHGLVYTETAEVVSQSDSSLKFRFDHKINDGYPFAYSLIITYELSLSGLKLKFEVENKGDVSMPFGLGWHPYFVSEEQENFSIQFKTDKKYLTNETMIPDRSEMMKDMNLKLSELEIDNSFRLTGTEILLKGPDRLLKIVVPGGSFLQLFNPSEKDCIAIEPMSCIPNAFNNKIGLNELAPGTVFKWNIELKVAMIP